MRGALGAVGAILALAAAFLAVPVVSVDAPVGALLLDREGRVLAARIADDEQWRLPSAGAVPDRFATALIVQEDRRFRAHPGVDPGSIAVAAWQNLRAGRVVRGGSTLTMQTVRIARGNPPRTLSEKAVEAVLALRLDAARSKDAILRTYADHAPFGGNVVGLTAASWRWFGRPPGALSWAEAATLAVLPNQPGLVHPGRDPAVLRAKRDRLLEALHGLGHLDAAALALAKAEPVPHGVRPFPRRAGHRLDRVADGQRVVSTLDRDTQARVEEVLAAQHPRLLGEGIRGLSAVVIDVPTGAVRAWVGNAAPPEVPGSWVDVVTARRSTGSTLKPFLYEAMLASGELLPTQRVPDLPLRFGAFAPENFDHRYVGALPADRALARSRNVPAVWMLRRHGVDRFHARLRDLGLASLDRGPDHYGLTLVVGGAEATLLELTGAYRQLALAADGVGEAPAVHWTGAAPTVAVVPEPGAAFATVEALQAVVRPGVDDTLGRFATGRRVAWKTGTSMGFRDGWAVGTTPTVAVGVWAGNPDGEGRDGLTGFQAAAPAFFAVLQAVAGPEVFEAPPELVAVDVCADSGERAGPDCPHVETRRVPVGALEAGGCTRCRRVHCVDEACTARAHAACTDGDLHATPWFVLPPAQAAGYARQHPGYRPLPPWAPGCAPPEEDVPFAWVSPRADARFVVPVDLDGGRSEVVFEVAHTDPDAVLHWHLDGAYLRSTERLHQVGVQPGAGRHELVVVDDAGHRLARGVEVVGSRGDPR